MTTAEKYLLKEQLEIANFDISREINPRMRIKKAKYWLDRLSNRFKELNFVHDNLLKIKTTENETQDYYSDGDFFIRMEGSNEII